MKEIRPIIFWEGFPVCGLLMKKVVDKFGADLIITATKPAVPFIGLEELLGHKIIWLDNPNEIWERRREFSDRNLVIHTGWNHKGWLKFDAYIKQKNKAKIVAVIDNSFKGTLRQYLGALWYRLYLKRFFDAVFVPGRSSTKLMRLFGVSSEQIYTGNYGAYEDVYRETKPINKRKDEFLFVGQLNKRKTIDILIQGFNLYRQRGGTWNLRLLGDGPLANICKGEGIILEGFAQPHRVAEKMNRSKVLILISREDHWGTVVCEAAACGMQLMTSQATGSSVDLVRSGINGIELGKLTPEVVSESMFYFEGMPEDILITGSNISRNIATGYDSRAYQAIFYKMCNDLCI